MKFLYYDMYWEILVIDWIVVVYERDLVSYGFVGVFGIYGWFWVKIEYWFLFVKLGDE